MKKLPAIFILISIFLFVVTVDVSAQSPTPEPTVLNPGDLAIIGFNFDDTAELTGEFAFVLLKDISPNTRIWFTDISYSNELHTFVNKDTSSEGIIGWIDSSQSHEKGEIIKILLVVDETNLKLDSNGDQIFAYQGGYDSPSFIFGLNSFGTNWYSNDETDLTSRNSHLPDTLNSTNSIAIPHVDNAIYTGPTSFSSPSAALTGIVTGTWSGDDYNRKIMPAGQFTFTPTIIDLASFEKKPSNSILIFVISLVIYLIVVFIFKAGKNKKSLN